MARSPRASGVIFPVVMSFGQPEQASDYRPVPASDTGMGYGDRGALGTYAPPADVFNPPAEIKFEAGAGATAEDMRRGFMDPRLSENPAYDMDNYKERWSEPRYSETDQGAGGFTESDWEFMNRNKRSKGFFIRPRIPIER